jgi:hypothetical protein
MNEIIRKGHGMARLKTFTKRMVLLLGISLVTMTNSGCWFWNLHLLDGFTTVALNYSQFWSTTPLIPVSPYYSELIEDTYHEEERYEKVPILDPVEGEHAPLFCLDPPTPDEVIRALPDSAAGGMSFIAETQRNNVRMVIELIVDRVDECKFYPLAGPARLHHCHYKCTVYYTKTIRSEWPVPFEHSDETQDVVYVDHDHLIRCAGPASPQ